MEDWTGRKFIYRPNLQQESIEGYVVLGPSEEFGQPAWLVRDPQTRKKVVMPTTFLRLLEKQGRLAWTGKLKFPGKPVRIAETSSRLRKDSEAVSTSTRVDVDDPVEEFFRRLESS